MGDRTITPGQHQGASMVGSEEIFKVEKGNQLAIRDDSNLVWLLVLKQSQRRLLHGEDEVPLIDPVEMLQRAGAQPTFSISYHLPPGLPRPKDLGFGLLILPYFCLEYLS